MDRELLFELYKRQSKIIYGYLIKCGCKREEAEDIVQDSFVKAIEYMDGVHPEKLSSWLFMVALNSFRNRRKKALRTNEISIDEEGFYSRIMGEMDTLERILLKEKRINIRDCLLKQKEEFRTLLILKYDMELSYREIGKLLGFSEDIVKTYLYRARNEFKKYWGENYGEG